MTQCLSLINLIIQALDFHKCFCRYSATLVQGSVNSLATAFSDNILEKTITPFEGEIISDPSIEAGDIVTIYDYSGNAYKTYITNVTL